MTKTIDHYENEFFLIKSTMLRLSTRSNRSYERVGTVKYFSRDTLPFRL